jgi:hypothetical protein
LKSLYIKSIYDASTTTTINYDSISTNSIYCNNIAVSGMTLMTSSNVNSYINTASITPSLTSSGNIDFAGSENAAAVNWVQANYVTLSAFSALAARVSALEG